MKLQESLFKEILDAQQFAVDPQHEAAFRTMLGKTKNRRRGFAFFFIFVLAGLGLIAFSWHLLQPGPIESQSQSGLQPVQDVAEASAYQAGSNETQDLQINTATPAETAENASFENAALPALHNENRTTTSGSQATSSTYRSTNPQTTHTAISAPAVVSNTRPETHTSTTSSPTVEADNKEQTSANGSATSLITSDDNSATKETDVKTMQMATGIRGTDSHDKEVLVTGAGVQESTEVVADAITSTMTSDMMPEEEATDAEIIPATRLAMQSKFALGATVMWSPVGGDGHLVQVGGNASYRLSPLWSLRSELGIGIQDGGFTFIKASENTVFGFGLDKERNEMRGEQLFTGYLSAEVARHAGKYQVFAGLQGQYLYGIKGDIRRERILLDVPLPVVATSENTWVSTGGVQRVSLQSFLGLRRAITSRLDVALSVRIPLMNTLRISPDAGQYTFELTCSGITPMLGASYKLYQQ